MATILLISAIVLFYIGISDKPIFRITKYPDNYEHHREGME
jgi:hypothetical protein